MLPDDVVRRLNDSVCSTSSSHPDNELSAHDQHPKQYIIKSQSVHLPQELQSSHLSSTQGELVSPEQLVDAQLLRLQSQLSSQIGAHRYQQWFEKTVWKLENDVLTICVAHQILLGWIQKQYRKSIEQLAFPIVGRRIEVEFAIDANLTGHQVPVENVTAVPANATPKTTSLRKLETKGPSTRASELSLLPAMESASRATRAGATASPRTRRWFRFEDFIVGDCNRLAYTTSRHIASHPLEDFSTLYIAGSLGTGKTALLQAIYAQITQHYPELKVLYLTAEDFGNQYAVALQSKTIASFRSKFRQIDILIVDDIDFLAGKTNFQEELLNTIRTLEQRGLKLIVSADRHARMLPGFSDELCNRLISGVFTKLQAPDSTTLRQMAVGLCLKLNFELSEAVIDFVARKFHRTFRELQGAINSLHAHSLMQGAPLTLSMAKVVLSELLRDSTRIIRLSDIEQAVAEMFGIDVATMKSASRARQVCQARMVAMYLSRHLLKVSFSEIGHHYGGRNHSTVVTAERKVREWIARQEQFPVASQLWSISELLSNIEQQLMLV